MVTKEFFQDYSLYDFINWLVSRCVDDSINNIKLGKPFKVIIINKIDLDGEYSYYHLGRINSIGELYHIFREYYINCNPTYPFYMDDNTKLYKRRSIIKFN